MKKPEDKCSVCGQPVYVNGEGVWFGPDGELMCAYCGPSRPKSLRGGLVSHGMDDPTLRSKLEDLRLHALAGDFSAGVVDRADVRIALRYEIRRRSALIGATDNHAQDDKNKAWCLEAEDVIARA